MGRAVRLAGTFSKSMRCAIDGAVEERRVVIVVWRYQSKAASPFKMVDMID